eukprot:gene2848-3647_t
MVLATFWTLDLWYWTLLEEIKSSINTLRETCTNGFSDTIEATNGTTSAIVDHLTQATEEHNKTAAQINAE